MIAHKRIIGDVTLPSLPGDDGDPVAEPTVLVDAPGNHRNRASGGPITHSDQYNFKIRF